MRNPVSTMIQMHGGQQICVIPFTFCSCYEAKLLFPNKLSPFESFRYVLIAYHGLYHRIYTRTNITLMIASVWAFSFGIMVPPLTESWGKLGKNNETKSCTILRYLLAGSAMVAGYSLIRFSFKNSKQLKDAELLNRGLGVS